VLPALGYTPAQLAALERTINAADAEVVVAATPIDLAQLIREQPVVRACYEFVDVDEPGSPHASQRISSAAASRAAKNRHAGPKMARYAAGLAFSVLLVIAGVLLYRHLDPAVCSSRLSRGEGVPAGSIVQEPGSSAVLHARDVTPSRQRPGVDHSTRTRCRRRPSRPSSATSPT